MHDIDRTLMEMEYERDDEYAGNEALELGEEFEVRDDEAPFNEEEEMELATELLSISSEEELDQFLGNLFKKIGRGLKKGFSFVSKIAKPMMGILKPLAKKALPFVGGALGSMIPIPGVGTAIGSSLGKALGNALEMEMEGVDSDEMDFEMARKFVRIAGTAIKKAASYPSTEDPMAIAKKSVINAIKQQVPSFRALDPVNRKTGKWVRRGNKIILLGV